MKDAVFTVAAVAIIAFVGFYIYKNVDVGCINLLGYGKACATVIH